MDSCCRERKTDQQPTLGIEPTYSAREGAAMLGRSSSWLDQRLREGEFTLPDGTTVQPLRTSGRYRRFTTEMLKDIAICSRNHHWFSWDKLQTTLWELAIAAYRDTGEPPWSSCSSTLEACSNPIA